MKTAKPITGSRVGDVIVAVGILSLMLLIAPRLRVYFQVTMVDVSAERVAPDGTRSAIPTPEQFKQVGEGYWQGNTLIPRLKPKIDAYMAQSSLAASAAPGTRYEWTVRWSDNSLKLDHAEQIVWVAP